MTSAASRTRWIVLAVVVAACGGGDDDGGGDAGPPAPDADLSTACEVGPVPAELGLDPFYRKHCQVAGLPIVSSDQVPDVAFPAVEEILRSMLVRADVRTALVLGDARIAIMSGTEATTDLPEHAFLADDPEVDWDTRARGLGGTPELPLTSCAEENLLCFESDPYRGESILLHELAHTFHLVGVDAVDPSFSPRLASAYADAMAADRWRDTYAATDPREYFAEGVQSYFEVNLAAEPADGIHGPIDTRAELGVYDPALFDLIAEVFPDASLSWSCTTP